MPKKAFTLVELLIIVAILGIVSTIAGVGLFNARAKSRDNKRASDLTQVQKALELAYAHSNGYPVVAAPTVIGLAATDVLCGQGTGVAFVPDAGPSNCDDGKVYMGLIPGNPSPNGAAYSYRSLTPSGAPCTAGSCTNYCLQAALEVGVSSAGLGAGTIVVEPAALRNGTCP